MSTYQRNHYVPQWYQHLFLPDDLSEKKFHYLDLYPETKTRPGGYRYKRKDLLRWGPSRCFYEDDLYTSRLGDWKSTEIEEYFFGRLDAIGKKAVEYFSAFQHPSVDTKAFHALLPYMTVQKLRTPKGLTHLANRTNTDDHNHVLVVMQQLQHLYCALWTECVWSIADASQSATKFIVSDHPVTVFNEACFPGSKWCRDANDPDIWLSGTHTLFPLGLEKILILTNLSWARNPYMDPLSERPHKELLRQAMFNFTNIQSGRHLSDEEVNQINYIIKQRANRYIAAAEKEWLYPELKYKIPRWDKLGSSYLLMPDPRSMTFSSEIYIGHKDGSTDAFDEYGRRPWHQDYGDKSRHTLEWETFHAFQGEYARLFGPKRRGQSFNFSKLDKEADDPDYHKYHLGLEQKYKPRSHKRRRRKK